MGPTTQKETGRDSGQREEVEEKIEVAAEGDQELKVFPENKEEQKREEALLTTIEKPKVSSLSRITTRRPPKSSHQQKLRQQQQKIKEQEAEEAQDEKRKTIFVTSMSRQLNKQSTQINRAIQILQPIQRQIKSTEKQSAIIR